MSEADWRRDVLTFWFGFDQQQWFEADPAFDEEMRERFSNLYEQKRRLPAESFLTDPLTALAGLILFDQFPRNMFRDHADQFQTDHLALAIAKGAVDRGYDEQVDVRERPFFYLPFQKRSIQLYIALGDDYLLGFARKHHDIIERFGRFPHRNAMLGRPPRPEETAAGEVVPR